MPYSNEEAYDMLAIYFQCFENTIIASRQYTLRYPDRRFQSEKVFRHLAENLRQTGQVHPVPLQVRRRVVRNENNVTNVLAYIHADPHVSIREIGRDLGLSVGSVHKILSDHRKHPYRMVLHQALTDRDFDSRLNFCYWLQNMTNEDPPFLSRILWTDEATFANNGRVNIHNMHYWADHNPHWMREVDHQHRWSLNVWCGIVEGRIIGPFFFDNRVNGEVFLHFLLFNLPELLEEVTLATRANMWLQLDGCPAHYAAVVRNHVTQQFPDRWIGRGSIFPWPPRSPDLTCLDFYLWGRIKDLVYRTRPTTRENMIERIQNAINGISRVEIENAVESTRRRLNRCIENNGRQFEHIM